MADAEYRALQCAGCGVGIFQAIGVQGRPRTRCELCSPKRAGRKYRPVCRDGWPPRLCASTLCGKKFQAPHGLTKHCSDQCRIDFHNAMQRQRKRKAYPARKCQECGVAFSSLTGRTQFCSAECKTKSVYRVRPGSTHRRRAKKHGCDYAEVNKAKVFDRDGWKCRLCGVATPKKLKGTQDDRAPELDHIIPMSLGGAHSYDNTQCACRRCNRMKSNRPMGQLHLGFGAI